MQHATATPVVDRRGRIPRHELAAMTFLASFNGVTHANYSNCLSTFFTWCEEHELDPLEVERAHLELYVRHCETDRGNHPSTISHKIGVLQGYYDFAQYDRYIETNPAARVRRPKWFADETSIVGLDRLELGALLQAAKAGTPTEDALITLLGVLGLRVSEACNVQIEDFGEQQRHHTVLHVVGKGQKAATIPLPPPVYRSLLRARGDRTTGPLLLRDFDGQPMNRMSAVRIVNRLSKKAGIVKKVRPHTLRHSMVTNTLDAGVPLRDVQVAARHEDPRTTSRYDRARLNLDRHSVYVLSAYLTGGA